MNRLQVLPGWSRQRSSGKKARWHRWILAGDGGLPVTTLCGTPTDGPKLDCAGFADVVLPRRQCAHCRSRARHLQHQAELPVEA